MKLFPCIAMLCIVAGIFLSGCITGEITDESNGSDVADAERALRESLNTINQTLEKDRSNVP